MQLSKIRVYQFRNIGEQEIHPASGCNLLSGRNGQGKTNLLEAIYFLGYARSFRTTAPRDCIRHGQLECLVEGIVTNGSVEKQLRIHISGEGKRLFVHGKSIGIEEFIGHFHVVAFTQRHLDIVRGGPAERRAFLDRAMMTVYPGHVRHLAAFSRVLKQRNRTLAMGRDGRDVIANGTLDSWDQSLVQEGSRILWNRLRYVQRMQDTFPTRLFGSDELGMNYESTVASGDIELPEIESQFEARLGAARRKDILLGYTSVGPHRDELNLRLNGKSLACFGSAGQQRSCLFSLYFAQMEIHQKEHGFYPAFLLDDVEAELDEQRLKTLLEYLAPRAQTFLTTAKSASAIALPERTRRFEVEAGVVHSIN